MISPKNPSDLYTRHVTNASVRETTGCPPVWRVKKDLSDGEAWLWEVAFPKVSLKQDGSASLAMWLIQIPSKIITKLSVYRSNHQETAGDLEGARVPPC